MKTNHLLAATALALLATGCVSQTSNRDEPRQSVRFASAQGAQTFYEAYLATFSPKGKGSLSVYIALPYSYQKVDTDNTRFNAAIRQADTNQDHVVSDEEVGVYASAVKLPN